MIHLEKGATYRAELDLPSIPFVNVRRIAREKLEGAGFGGVVVYDVGSTYAQGTWGGETGDVQLPTQVVHVWRVRDGGTLEKIA